MSKKKNNPPETPAETSSEQQIFVGVDFANPQRLSVGVNFVAQGDTEETRIEPGIIEAGTLPPAFENALRERKQLIDVD